jgi:hypothetical protein
MSLSVAPVAVTVLRMMVQLLELKLRRQWSSPEFRITNAMFGFLGLTCS